MRSRGIGRVVGIGACVCALAMAAAAASKSRFGSGEAAERTEVLIGYHHCGVSFSENQTFGWLSFDSTGDVLPRYTSLYRRATPATPDACDAQAAQVRAALAAQGCTAGDVETSEDETGRSEDFQFVCHGLRSEIVAVLAELAAQQLAPSP